MIAPSKFTHQNDMVQRHQLHQMHSGDYDEKDQDNLDVSNYEDTLQRSMMIGDMQMDTSKDMLRNEHNTQNHHEMSAFVDQDVSQ